jgi:hypothetical protein
VPGVRAEQFQRDDVAQRLPAQTLNNFSSVGHDAHHDPRWIEINRDG